MQVFKLYFKVLRRYMGNMFMYVGIFIAVTLGVIVPQVTKNAAEGYTAQKSNFAVFDYDDSELSRALVSYLESVHKIKTLDADEEELIQDELYAMSIHNVIRIQDGFEEAFLAGDAARLMEIVAVPDTITTVLFEQSVSSYLSVVNTYVTAGFDVNEATEKAVKVTNTSVDVEFTDKGETFAENPLHYYFKYLSWVFIALCVGSITIVLTALNKKEVRNRIECSPYKFMKMNMEIVIGVLLTGFAICLIFIAAAFLVFPQEMVGLQAVLYSINTFCVMTVALAITFLVGKITDSQQIISLMSNIIGLGMAFLCGVFVPMEYLSDTVIKIAHFLPVYWNVKALQVIGSYQTGDGGTLFSYIGIQVMFAVVIVCVGLIVDRRKRVQC